MNKKLSIYLVGGAVRDTLLGLTPKDKDYVIVGATEQDVADLIAQGYERVGADFPVFLHPETKEEYALARIERKVGVGYGGFETFTSPELTIEDDLRRRDLTINAMAMDLETGEIIDPFGGQKDLENRILRHVSEAFAEDPLRVLRVARFNARYGFLIHHKTLDLMHELVVSGELDHLSRERVWTEFEKLLSERHSIDGICSLLTIGAIDRLFGEDVGRNIETISQCSFDTCTKFEMMDVISKFAKFSYFANWTDQEMQDMKIPRHFQQAHRLLKKLTVDFMHIMQKDAAGLHKFIEDAGILKTSNTFGLIIGALMFSVSSHFDNEAAFKIMSRIRKAAEAAAAVDCAALAEGIKNGKLIAERIRNARIEAIQQMIRVEHV